MLKSFGFINSIFLIGIIFLQLPEESLGLTSFAPKSKLFLNILTAFGLLIYFGIAIQLNLSNK